MNELSENVQVLLGYLKCRGGDFFGHIGERNGAYYVIPTPNFNWDPRIQIESQRVRHPECIKELVDRGFLVFGEHSVGHSDYSNPVVNQVYSLTDKGKEWGAKMA